MTEFEQQVASALRSLYADGELSAHFRITDSLPIEKLAPRVAAAIQAAHDDGVADGWGRSIGMAEAALPALRGEP